MAFHFCITIVYFNFLLAANGANNFRIALNSNLKASQENVYLIETLSKPSNFQCLAKCAELDGCLACSFDQISKMCQLYGNYLNDYELVQLQSIDFYAKKVPNLLNLFKKYQSDSIATLNSRDSNRNFDVLNLDGKVLYYVANLFQISIYDINWNLVSIYPVSASNVLYYIKIVETDIYMAIDGHLVKTDLLFKVIISTPGSYREMFYHSATDRLYVTDNDGQTIAVFDRGLNLKQKFITGKAVHGISVLNDIWYVSALGEFVAYENGEIAVNFQIFCPSVYIVSVTMDKFGYISVACEDFGFFLYHINGSFMNYTISLEKARYLNFDEKSQAVLLAHESINFDLY